MGVLSAPTDGTALRKSHASRPAREDHDLPTSLEDRYSDWKVLVGPNDWQNHYKGREGAVKYRLHNLPSIDGFHSGVYELALYLDKSIYAHATRKGTSSSPRKDAFVPVYVGQAENVRDRLQYYGRSGSHLEGLLQEGKCQQCEISYITVSQKNLGFLEKITLPSNQELCSFPHLFTKAFARGYSIAFRWTRTESKADAEDLEARLLQSYDYAWNRGSNGKRRPEDAIKKLQHISNSQISSKLSKWINKLHKIGPSKVRIRNLSQNRVGGQLDNPAARVSVSDESTQQMFKLLSLYLRRKVTKEHNLPFSELICNKKHDGHGHSETSMCGIIDDNGNICTSTPLPGRKRCEAHKGMRRCLRPSADSSILTRESEVSVCRVIDGNGIAENFRKPYVKVSACKDSGAAKLM